MQPAHLSCPSLAGGGLHLQSPLPHPAPLQRLQSSWQEASDVLSASETALCPSGAWGLGQRSTSRQCRTRLTACGECWPAAEGRPVLLAVMHTPKNHRSEYVRMNCNAYGVTSAPTNQNGMCIDKNNCGQRLPGKPLSRRFASPAARPPAPPARGSAPGGGRSPTCAACASARHRGTWLPCPATAPASCPG